MITGATVALAIAGARGDDLKTMAMAVVAGGVAGLVPDWLQINMPGASKQIKGMFGHRGFSHWAWIPLILLFTAWAHPLALPTAAGWLSHILLDALADGVPAFWPFGRLTLAHVKTGGKIDRLFGGGALVVFASLVVSVIL